MMFDRTSWFQSIDWCAPLKRVRARNWPEHKGFHPRLTKSADDPGCCDVVCAVKWAIAQQRGCVDGWNITAAFEAAFSRAVRTLLQITETKLILDLEDESRAVLQAHLNGCQTSTCVMLVEPRRMNARLAVQQGCFVVPGDLSKSFMENLACCLDVEISAFAVGKTRSVRHGDGERLFETPVVKIILPRDIHNQAMWDLHQMNVNATSLFPGLDGFARSLHTWFRDVL
jgi:hypothetical protein